MAVTDLDKKARTLLSYHQFSNFFKSLYEGNPVISFELCFTEIPTEFASLAAMK
jgi:hypothetical protein